MTTRAPGEPSAGLSPAPSLAGPPRSLIIACGALARELLAIIRVNGWSHMDITCLPASLHNRPEHIPERVRDRIRENRDRYDAIYVAYADCGTGGLLDRVLAEEGVTRIGGPHCYSFFAGHEDFDRLMDEELGSFFLTDYLVRHFHTLIIKGLGLDRHPELQDMMFGNYRRLVYLAQTDDADLVAKAQAAADRLGLAFEMRRTGMGELARFVQDAAG
ncbi:MAG: DUF1638 domain-containing protein, partial [Alphaproteobacteria bacterium]